MAVALRLQKNGGFTLLEVMIAVAIIALAVVTLLGAQSQSVTLVAGTKFDSMASMLAQWKMSDLLLEEFDQLADDQGNFGEDYPQFYWTVQVSELGERETGLKGIDDRLKALDIAVISHDNDRMRFTMRTLVYKAMLKDTEDKASDKESKAKEQAGKKGAGSSSATPKQKATPSSSSEASP